MVPVEFRNRQLESRMNSLRRGVAVDGDGPVPKFGPPHEKPAPPPRGFLDVQPGRRGSNGRRTVVQYTSKDLETWNGRRVIFEIPGDFWTQRGIWAPELHAYRGKFYLFLTFDSDQQFPEQWRNWLPRVKRGSQVLVADAPTGPFQPFANRSTLPPDMMMMMLDGTLRVEDGVPYMVFCHEWLQIKDGTVEYMQLKDDLSETVGEPKRLFHRFDGLLLLILHQPNQVPNERAVIMEMEDTGDSIRLKK